MKDFFERATALRDTIEQSNDFLKNVKLDILSQLVGQVFLQGKIPDTFMVHSNNMNVAQIAIPCLKNLGIEAHYEFCSSVPYSMTVAISVDDKS